MKKPSQTALLNYIEKNINTESPSTNDSYNFYFDGHEISHTTGSMSSPEKELLTCLDFRNEFAPYTRKMVKTAIEFRNHQWNALKNPKRLGKK